MIETYTRKKSEVPLDYGYIMSSQEYISSAAYDSIKTLCHLQIKYTSKCRINVVRSGWHSVRRDTQHLPLIKMSTLQCLVTVKIRLLETDCSGRSWSHHWDSYKLWGVNLERERQTDREAKLLERNWLRVHPMPQGHRFSIKCWLATGSPSPSPAGDNRQNGRGCAAAEGYFRLCKCCKEH